MGWFRVNYLYQFITLQSDGRDVPEENVYAMNVKNVAKSLNVSIFIYKRDRIRIIFESKNCKG